MPWKHLARDAGALAALFAAWSGALSWAGAGGGVAAAGVAAAGGIALAFAAGYVAHEWGHLAGALLGGSRVRANPLRSFLLFSFDRERHSRRQFQWLGWGGNLAPWLVTALIVALVPAEGAGRLALRAAAVGGPLFTNLTEVPILVRHARGDATSLVPSARRSAWNAAAAVAAALLFTAAA